MKKLICLLLACALMCAGCFPTRDKYSDRDFDIYDAGYEDGYQDALDTILYELPDDYSDDIREWLGDTEEHYRPDYFFD